MKKTRTTGEHNVDLSESNSNVLSERSNLNLTHVSSDVASIVLSLFVLAAVALAAIYINCVETRIQKRIEGYRTEMNDQFKSLEKLCIDLSN
jgi:hypothetical protein